MKRIVHPLALLLLVVATADAQQVAGTFDQLRVLVQPGDTLTITDAAGQRLRGKLAELSAASLVLDVSGTRRVFPGTDVDIIEKRGSDPLKNGALIGLSIGAGVFGPAIGATTRDWRFGMLAAVLYGGIGAGIGVGVDALIEGQHVIYAASPPTRTSFNVTPILSRSRKGALFSIGLR